MNIVHKNIKNKKFHSPGALNIQEIHKYNQS